MEGNTVDLIWLIWSLIYPSYKNWATVNSPVLFFFIGSSWVFSACGNLLPAWLGQTFYYYFYWLVILLYYMWYMYMKIKIWSITCIVWMSYRHLSTLKLKLLRMSDFASYILHLDQKAVRSLVQPKNRFCKFRSLYYHDQKKAWLCSFRKGFTSKIPSSELVMVHIHVQHWFIYYGTNM